MTSLPQGLSRERLAELRAIAEGAPQVSWDAEMGDHTVRANGTGRFIADCWENARPFIATFDPPTVLALIAQCESSPTGEGEDGPLIESAHEILADYTKGHDLPPTAWDVMDSLTQRLSASNAALAEAVAALHPFVKHVAYLIGSSLTVEEVRRAREFLAKHGPSP